MGVNNFYGLSLTVLSFSCLFYVSNPKKLKAGKYGITGATLDSYPLPVEKCNFLVIPRKNILALSVDKTHTIEIILG